MQFTVTKKELPESQIELFISLPAAEFKTFTQKAAQKISKTKSIPGFRPGKATPEAVESKVGLETLIQEAAELAVKESYLAALLQEKLLAVGPPQIEVKKIGKGADLEFQATVAIFPKMQLCDLSQIKVEKPDLKKIKADPKKIEQTLENLRKMRAKLTTVKRAAQKGDRVEIDFKLSLAGVPQENGESKNHPLVIGENRFIPGFEEELIGLKEGEEKSFKLRFPKTYHAQNLQDKEGEFLVKMKLVQEQELPELNDELAKNLGHFKSLEEFKKNLEDNQLMEQKLALIDKSLTTLLETIAEKSLATIPAIMIEDEKKKMLEELRHNVSHLGISFEQYLEQIKKTQEDLLKSWDEGAKKRLLVSLALQEIAQKKDIKAEEKEVEARLHQLIHEMGASPEELKNIDPQNIQRYAQSLIVNDKVIAYLKKEFLGVDEKDLL